MDGAFRIKDDMLYVPEWHWDSRQPTLFGHPVRVEASPRKEDARGADAPSAYLTFANGWVIALGFLVYDSPAPTEYIAGVVAGSTYAGNGRIVHDLRSDRSLGLFDAAFQLTPRIEEVLTWEPWDPARGVIVARSHTRKSPEQLIASHVEPNPATTDVAEYRLRREDNGYPVWSIIGDLDPGGANIEQVARDYAISREAVEAVLAFYARNMAAIDARLAASRAA